MKRENGQEDCKTQHTEDAIAKKLVEKGLMHVPDGIHNHANPPLQNRAFKSNCHGCGCEIWVEGLAKLGKLAFDKPIYCSRDGKHCMAHRKTWQDQDGNRA